jgi:hypothetical protein
MCHLLGDKPGIPQNIPESGSPDPRKLVLVRSAEPRLLRGLLEDWARAPDRGTGVEEKGAMFAP